MKRALPILLISLFSILAIQSDKIRYYRSEAEFLSGYPVTRHEVRNKAHIRGEFDPQGRLILKSSIDEYGNTLSTELYSYVDTLTEAHIKEVYSAEDSLLQKTTFGHEEKTEEYIEYVYTVDTVKKWTDRFTVQDLNEKGQVEQYRFFDVDAFEYGNIWFEYDSLGHMSKQEWIRKPSGKTMRKWLYAFDPETQVTYILEYDSTGALVFEINLSPDGTEAIFWFSWPEDSAFVNHSRIKYKLDGDLEYGHLAWTLSDSTLLHIHDTLRSPMSKQEIKGGDHEIDWGMDTVMVDSMDYDVIFTGFSTKGYVATKRWIKNLHFDISPPLMELAIDPFIRLPELEFGASEPLTGAYLVWIPDVNDSRGKIDTVHFTESELIPDTALFQLENQTQLRDSVLYEARLYGIDRAGNLSRQAIVDSILFDITAPILAITVPTTGSFVNQGEFAFSVDERLLSWEVTVSQEGGVQDPDAPHVIEMETQDTITVFSLDITEHAPLVDGAVYRISVTGVDLAGNVSAPAQVENITYDITPPVLTLIYPFDDAAIKDPSVSYAVNEPLSVSEFRWEQTGGSKDTLSPRIIPLEGEELHSGEKVHLNLKHEPVLSDGSIYSLTFSGADLAGNAGEVITVTGIVYDISPPQFTDLSPVTGSAVNHMEVSYSVSEKLHEGSITWEWQGGTKDPERIYRMELSDNELEAGLHQSITLINTPLLKDGGIYAIEIRGSDRAGNQSDTLGVRDVLYDFTAPVITLTHPLVDSYLNHKSISYSLSENLYDGKLSWMRTGGGDDPDAPYEIDLLENERSRGKHNDIVLSGMPDVLEGPVYRISFNGSDRAGNAAAPVIVSGLIYDFTPPVISISAPGDGMAVNHKRIGYELSENLKEGIAVWEWTDGIPDRAKVHEQKLSGRELNLGEHSNLVILNAPPLVDGGIYNFRLSGTDPAGNESNLPSVSRVLYDITAPVFTLTAPLDDQYVPTPAVTYELSEKLHQGSIAYRQVSGKEDMGSPHIFGIEGLNGEKGLHSDIYLEGGPELVEGGVYNVEFSGRDRAGNQAVTALIKRIIYDATPPSLAILAPAPQSAVNHKKVGISNSERLESGTMVWKRIGGEADPGSPHNIQLVNSELNEGDFSNLILVNSPALKDGAIYEISYYAADFAGNQSETVTVSDVLYDVTPPVISILSPGSNIFSTETNIQYSLSEDLGKGELKWGGVGPEGMEVGSVHPLVPAARNAGEHWSDDHFIPEVIDGGNYTVTISGSDPAGNEARPVRLTNYKVDRTPPVFSDLFPTANSFIRSDEIAYTVSEKLASGKVTFKQKHAFSVPLAGIELNDGTFGTARLSGQRSLDDGAVYSISIFGTDFAGNISDTLNSENVTYDISPPRLALLQPESGSFITSTEMKIFISEPLLNSQIIWTDRNGAEVVYDLTESELLEGEHDLVDKPLALEENIPYTLTFTGIDRAGNEGASKAVSGVTYDGTPPLLVLSGPVSNSAVNHRKFSFSTNEPLSAAILEWTAVQGVDPGSPHRVELSGTLLETGDHNDIELDNPPGLAGGVTYTVRLTGADRAKNEAVPVFQEMIRYDITPPAYTDISPAGDTLLNQLVLDYVISEDLSVGKITIMQSGGGPAFDLNLEGNRLKAGKGGGDIPSSMALKNGKEYEISFYGKDFAGNETEETKITGIKYDDQKPALMIVTPQANKFVNTNVISFGISEDLKSGTLELTRIDGAEDPSSPHKLNFKKDFLKAGSFPEQVISGLDKWQDGSIYSLKITGTDLAGNVGDPFEVEKFIYDITPPEISPILPTSESEINYETVSFILSEDVEEAQLVVTRVEGAQDSRSPQNIRLQGNELKQGQKDSLKLKGGPNLVNGTWYDYVYTARDFAGNEAVPAAISRVGYDNEPPVVSISQPIDAEQIKNTLVSYMVSDQLGWGRIVMKQTGGTVDPLSPHVIELTGAQLKQGFHAEVDLNLLEKLADGGRYSISIEGGDRAGNAARVSEVRNVLFDVKPPELALIFPADASIVNHTQISFETSENMLEGRVTFTHTGGKNDPQSPHVYELNGAELEQGLHENLEIKVTPPLNDGSIYSISLDGMDLAGNVANTVSINNILYDISPPVLAITSPPANSYQKALSTEFSFNEKLASGVLEVIRQKGNPDLESPHQLEFSGALLEPGTFQEHLSEKYPLQSGVVYSIRINGSDLAGNPAQQVLVDEITLDFEPPKLSITSPETGVFVNHTRFGIRLDENLQSASISWTQENGESAPQERSLTGQYLVAGAYDNILLASQPALVSGSTYSVTYTGTDLAGNIGTTAITGIPYDDQPPVFIGHFPPANAFIKEPLVSYEVDEPLVEGALVWTATGGNADPSSPRRIGLTDAERQGGLFPQQTLSGQTDLSDGTVYTLSAEGTDRAGNSISVELIEEITFDISKPKFTRVFPAMSTRINSPLTEFTVNEDLAVGSFTWKHMGGVADPNAPHEIPFGTDMLSKGSHDSQNLPPLNLVTGTMYRITFAGTDLAGNVGKKLVMNLVYDDIPPTIELIYPESNSQINNSKIAYKISEALGIGAFTYTQTGGGSDPNSPHRVALKDLELEIVQLSPVKPSNAAVLQDGTIYAVEFTGEDLASNAGEPVKVENVLFDITKPEISLSFPEAGKVSIGQKISYSLSEELVSGTAVWSREGGNPDPKAPHSVEFSAGELVSGDHSDIVLSAMSDLMPGTQYTLTLKGTDKAGNESNPASVRGFDYVRSLDGNWFFQGAIMTVVWTFEGEAGTDGTSGVFAQGVKLGTKISNQEFGRYTLDYSSKPWVLDWSMDGSDQRRISLFEFTGLNNLRVVTGTKKPRSWTDGEIMEYEYRP